MNTDRLNAIDVARAWTSYKPIYLDTETTGLDHTAEMVEIAILDHNGNELFCSLIKPTQQIPHAAIAIHGITNAMVRDAPTFREVAAQVWDLIYSSPLVITYNAEFDSRIVCQSAYANLLNISGRRGNWRCAMKLYSRYQGTYDTKRNGFSWHTLANAIEQCNIVTPPGFHRAKADAIACRLLIEHIAKTGEDGR